MCRRRTFVTSSEVAKCCVTAKGDASNMCGSALSFIYIYIYVYLYLYLYLYLSLSIFIYLYIYISIYLYIHASCMHVNRIKGLTRALCVCIYVHIHIYTLYIYIYICILYIYTYTYIYMYMYIYYLNMHICTQVAPWSRPLKSQSAGSQRRAKHRTCVAAPWALCSPRSSLQPWPTPASTARGSRNARARSVKEKQVTRQEQHHKRPHEGHKRPHQGPPPSLNNDRRWREWWCRW